MRATDEGVPIALSGYRPRVTGTITAGATGQSSDHTVGQLDGVGTYTGSWDNFAPHSFGVTATQTLYNGMQTANRTRQAESQVSAGRETLRLTEQNVLLNAATAYMNLLRDTATLDLQKRNVEVLQEQLRQTRDRFNVGEVTKTDVAQSEVAPCGRPVADAGALNRTSRRRARPTARSDRRRAGQACSGGAGRPFLAKDISPPRSGRGGWKIQRHRGGVGCRRRDIAGQDQRGRALSDDHRAGGRQLQRGTARSSMVKQLSFAALGTVSVPLFQGGGEYATIRQSKETLGQRRMDLDTQRDTAQQAVVQAWGQLEAAKAQIIATQAQVAAAETALNGVREEARVGQRTTLDVLNAQQELVNARVALVNAQRDRVVASYSLLAATGGCRSARSD